MSAEFDLAVAGILADYTTERERHHLTAYESRDGTCKCGYAPPAHTRSPRRSLGLHLAHVERAADTEFDRRVAAWLAAHR